MLAFGQAKQHTAETPVPEPIASEVELTIDKLKTDISPDLIKAGVEHFAWRFVNLLFLFGRKRYCDEEWKESIIVPIRKKGDKKDCDNYRDISLLPSTYKTLSNILLSRLIPYAKEIIGDHQCGFRHNRTIDHIFCIGLEISADKSKYKVKSPDQNAGRIH